MRARTKAAALRGHHEALGKAILDTLDARLKDLVPPVAKAA